MEKMEIKNGKEQSQMIQIRGNDRERGREKERERKRRGKRLKRDDNDDERERNQSQEQDQERGTSKESSRDIDRFLPPTTTTVANSQESHSIFSKLKCEICHSI